METKIYAALSNELHNELHREKIEHPHANRHFGQIEHPFDAPNAYHYGDEACLKISVTFDEEIALTLLDISVVHSFNVGKSLSIPIKQNGKYRVSYRAEIYNEKRPDISTVDTSPASVITESVSIAKLAAKQALETKTWFIDANPIIIELRDRYKTAWEEVKPLVEEAEKERLVKVAELEKQVKESKAKWEAEKTEEQRVEALRTEEKKVKKDAWIKANGGERLRIGWEKGYNCEKLFTIELLRNIQSVLNTGRTTDDIILDEVFVLDYNNDVSTKDRSCPSLAALQLCEELEKHDWISNVAVKWLPQGFEELENRGYEEPEGFEAVEIKINGHYAYLRI